MTTANVLSDNELTTESCQRPRSLETCVSSYSPVPLGSTEDLQTWLQQAFPVNPSPSPESSEAQTMTAICGQQPCAVYKSSDPNMSFSKMFLALSQHDPSIVYVAGLVDGEGSIGILSSEKGQQYYAEVTIGMSDKASNLLKAVQERFGGTIVHGRGKTEKWAASMKWRIGGDAALDFLRQIQPYLMLKLHQAETCLKLVGIMDSMELNPNGTKKWTEKTRKAAARLKEEMHRLNKKGPDAPDAGAGWYKPQETLFGTLEKFSGPWPKAGLIVAGEYYPQPKWVRRISEIGSGLLPTPNADMGDATNKLIPKGNHFVRPSGVKAHLRLTEYVKQWPTPRAGTDTMCGETGHWQMLQGTELETGRGQLNPMWVEWLMGWPIGWTSLEPLAPEAWQQWLDTALHTWWVEEPPIPRIAGGIKHRVDRLKAIGNGQVSVVAATAWQLLTEDLCNH